MATDLFSNPRFVEFRAQLEAQGATLRLLWSAKTGRNPSGKGYDDLGLFSVHTRKGKLKHNTLIVQDFGERDGYSLWLDAPTNDYQGDIAEILGE